MIDHSTKSKLSSSGKQIEQINAGTRRKQIGREKRTRGKQTLAFFTRNYSPVPSFYAHHARGLFHPGVILFGTMREMLREIEMFGF